MSLNILIVDDDTLARQRMRQLLSRCSADLCGTVEEAADAARAAGLIRHRRFDLVLLDVRMPGGDNGLTLATSLRHMPKKPAVVFVTGHAEHALAAFEADAIDYLTKPVRPERLERALAKAADLKGASFAAGFDANSLNILQRGQATRLPLADVLYLRAEAKRITVITAHGSFTLDGALVDLETRHADKLVRVHRHTLAALAAITSIRRVDDDQGNASWHITLRDTTECLPVARRLVANVRAQLLERSR